MHSGQAAHAHTLIKARRVKVQSRAPKYPLLLFMHGYLFKTDEVHRKPHSSSTVENLRIALVATSHCFLCVIMNGKRHVHACKCSQRICLPLITRTLGMNLSFL